MNEKVVITLEELHEKISLAVLGLIENLKTQIQVPELPEFEQKKAYDLYQKHGLTESKEFQELSQARQEWLDMKDKIEGLQKENEFRLEALKFYTDAIKTLGDTVFMIPFEVFEELAIKYDLVCRELSDYSGSIPFKVLEKFDQTYEILKNSPEITGKLWHLLKISEVYDRGWHKQSKQGENSLRVFPFLRSFKELSGYGHIEWHKTNVSDVEKRIDAGVRSARRISTKLFIVAPESEMKDNSGATKVIVEDPLICSMTDYGIICFAAWGPDGNDTCLEKYKNFSKSLMKYYKGLKNK